MTTIKVLPNKPSAIGLKHPAGPPLAKGGSLWPNDSFTARRLTDGSVIRASDVPAEPAPAAAAEPAEAGPTA